jgi:hypothetical protein
MKIGRIGAAALALCGVGVLAEAGLPKPASLLKKTTTCQSQGAYGLRTGKYAKPSWGNRWRQSLQPAPVIVSPYVRGR